MELSPTAGRDVAHPKEVQGVEYAARFPTHLFASAIKLFSNVLSACAANLDALRGADVYAALAGVG
jgi:primosomal protein N''